MYFEEFGGESATTSWRAQDSYGDGGISGVCHVCDVVVTVYARAAVTYDRWCCRSVLSARPHVFPHGVGFVLERVSDVVYGAPRRLACAFATHLIPFVNLNLEASYTLLAC